MVHNQTRFGMKGDLTRRDPREHILQCFKDKSDVKINLEFFIVLKVSAVSVWKRNHVRNC